METPPFKRWAVVLGLYLVAGGAVGFIPIQQFMATMGLRPGYGTALAVNLGLPGAALLLALWRGKLWSVWAGAALLVAGFWLGAMLRNEPKVWYWTPAFALQVGHPILLAAGVGCGVIGTVVVLGMRLFRKEVAVDPALCSGCGYLIGDGIVRCPECGLGAGAVPIGGRGDKVT